MTIVYIYIALAAYNTGYLTLPMGSVENIVDRAANVAVLDRRGIFLRKGADGRKDEVGEEWEGGETAEGVDREKLREMWSVGTDAVMDVPVGGVCEILYGEGG